MHPFLSTSLRWLSAGLDPNETDPRLLRHVRTITAVATCLIMIAVPFSAQYLRMGMPSMTIAVLSAAVIGMVDIYLLRRTQNMLLCGHIAVADLFLLLLLSNVNSGGFYDPNLAWLYVIPVVGGLLAGTRAAVTWGAITLATVMGFYGVQEGLGWTVPDVVPAADHAIQSLANRVSAIVALIACVVAFLREREVSDTQLLATAEEARAADLAKTEFLANMSHEMRTPMHGVLGFSDLLLESRLDPSQLMYTRNLKLSAEAAMELIDDVLDLSRIESGVVLLEETDFEIRRLVEETSELVRPRLGQVALVRDIDPETPKWLRGDVGQLRQVLVNLIGNAVKFTEQGRIDVIVRGHRVDSTGTWLYVAVRDTGIGIKAEAQHRIFQAFTQADSSTTRVFGGTGLGLAICEKIVTRVGGEIGCDSRPGEGSTFWFTFPTQAARQPTDHDVRSSVAACPPSSHRRVLVVDDQHVNRLVGIAMLEQLGVEAVGAASAAEAIEMHSDSPFELIFMDVQMPGIDGLEATRRLRALEFETGRRTPIVALTAHAMTTDRTRCLEAGMDEYLTKPCRSTDLEDVLSRWTHKDLPSRS